MVKKCILFNMFVFLSVLFCTIYSKDSFPLRSQLEVQWAFSAPIQWGTVHALHVIYNGHCSYTVVRYSVHTVVTYSVHSVDTLYVHCIQTVPTVRTVATL